MGFWIMFLDGCSFIHRIKVIKSIRGREAFMCIEYNETILVVEFEIFIQQIFIQYLLSVRHYGSVWEYINKKYQWYIYAL